MDRIAVIPARGGSKRIKRKNVKLFDGKPIIEYVIKNSLNSGLFDRVVVSTDDEEISRISMSAGAEVPFLRSKKNSGDRATTSDVLLEVLDQLKSKNSVPDLICCIYPTAVLLDFQFVEDALNKIQGDSLHTVLSVVEYEHPIWRAFRFDTNQNEITMVWPEHRSARTQDLEKTYHDAGQFYWIHVHSFLKSRQMLQQPFSAVVLPQSSVQDIDDKEDWKMAEIKYRLNHS